MVDIPRPTTRYQNARFRTRSTERTILFLPSRKRIPVANNTQKRVAIRTVSMGEGFSPCQSFGHPDSWKSGQSELQEKLGKEG